MQVSVESTGALERRMTVAVPADQFEKALTDRLRRLSKSVKMPGFRPGKVPLKMVEAQYGGQVMQEVAGDLINSSFQEAVGQEGLRPAAGPTIEPKAMNRGQDLEYVATFEVLPEVKAPDLTGVTIDRPTCEVTDEDVDRTLERMRQQRVQWDAQEDTAAEDGCRVTMDFAGSRDGNPVEGTSAQGFQVVVGSGNLVADFEQKLIGLKTGEQKQLDVKFPDDYNNAELAGQSLQFDVQVTEVAKSRLPEVDDEFAKVFGVKDGGVAALRKEVQSNLEREVADRIRLLVRDRIMAAVVEASDIEVPARLVQMEAQRMLEVNRNALQQGGMPEDRLPADASVYQDQAQRRVLLGLVLSEASREYGLTPSPDQVRAAVERLAQTYEDPAEFVKWHYADPKRLTEVEATVMEELVVERLLEQSEVVDVPMGFAELMYPKPATDNQK